MAVIQNLIEGCRIREHNGSVIELINVAVIDALPVGIAGQLQALTTASVPQAGDEHPNIAGLFVVDRNVNPIAPTQAQVEIVYRTPDFVAPPGQSAKISGSVSAEQISTMKERDGEQIFVKHWAGLGSPFLYQGGEVDVLVPRDEIQFARTEQSNNPQVIPRGYVSKVNDATWYGGAPFTWLCVDISFELSNASTTLPTYSFTYRFRHNPDGHDPQIVYIDEQTGRPPPGLVEFIGYKTVIWYEKASFQALGL